MFAVLTALVLVPATASAAEEAPVEPPPARPVQYGSLEVNPLAMLAGLFGGQVQVGVAGPVTLQGGLSYFSKGEDVRCAGSDGCTQSPGGHGAVLEVGPRIFFPLHKGTYLWVGPAWGHNWMVVEPTNGFHDGFSNSTGAGLPRSTFQKNRAIVDLGVHVPVGTTPLYFLGGVGYSQSLDSHGAGKLDPQSPNLASSLFDWTYPSQYVAGGSSIRVLFAFGAGF